MELCFRFPYISVFFILVVEANTKYQYCKYTIFLLWKPIKAIDFKLYIGYLEFCSAIEGAS